jgi:Clustered mitochondria/Translation initiation factor eIF3 subunit 135
MQENEHRNWTMEFQEIFESRAVTSGLSAEQTRGDRLGALWQEFEREARRIAEVIVRERHLPLIKRSVMPIENCGRAGGEKFFMRGIFFKYARDLHGLYQGDEFAMKAAGHELRGLNAYVSGGAAYRIRFPMMCLVDVAGWRIMACSLLPIVRGRTIMYGSEDTAKTVHADVPRANRRMEAIARLLNLKRHMVGRGADESALSPVAGPADIELHKGLDGRWWIADTARVFPPEAPNVYPSRMPTVLRQHRSGRVYLYRHLRPELVAQFSKPLSSDAYSNFGSHDRAQHDGEVADATRFLFDVVAPAFAASLEQRFSASVAALDDLMASPRVHATFVSWYHMRGINVRWMGLVHSMLANERLRQVSLEEMLARCLKAHLNAELRGMAKSTRRQHKRIAVRHSLRYFGAADESLRFWDGPLRRALDARFEMALFGAP